MAVRLIVTITALPGKGTELARAMAPRLAEVRKEPGCEQYDLFTRRTPTGWYCWSAGPMSRPSPLTPS